MREKKIKLRHDVDLIVSDTVSISTGQRVVEMREDRWNHDGVGMSPAEAERLGYALIGRAWRLRIARSKARRKLGK